MEENKEINNCHSRVSLSGISALEKTKAVGVPDNNLRVRQYKKAFTLIELLVVVLIIGILSAIALPQYQKAVIKSRVATILPLGKAIAEAKEIYYIENNNYTRDVEVLGIQLPDSCSYISSGYYSCGNYFLFDNNATHLVIDYCPGKNETYADCEPVRDFSILWAAQHQEEGSTRTPGAVYCNVFNNSSLGKSVCKSFPELIYQEF